MPEIRFPRVVNALMMLGAKSSSTCPLANPLTWDNFQVISMSFCDMDLFIFLHLIYFWSNLVPDFPLNLGKVGFESLELIFNPSKCVRVQI